MARSAIRRGIYAVQVLVLGAMMLTTVGTASHRSTTGDPTAGTLADLTFETAVALSPVAATVPLLDVGSPPVSVTGDRSVTSLAVGQIAEKSMSGSGPESADGQPSTVGLRKLVAYDGALRPGWFDLGWSKSRIVNRGPAKIDMGERQGWIVARKGIPLHATVLQFRYRTEKPLGQILLVTLGSASVERTAELGIANLEPDAKGWYSASLSISALNPKNVPYDRVRIRPTQRRPSPFIVEIDKIAFFEPNGGVKSTAGVVPATTASATSDSGSVTRGDSMSIDCADVRHRISPLIYGIGYSGVSYLPDTPWTLGATTNRWGGNPTSRYNWQVPNAWNTANDYFFRNVAINGEQNASEAFLANNQRYGMLSAVTVPMLGWVAKDTTSYSFPVSKFGQQQATDPSNGDIGNGLAIDGRPLSPGSPKSTSVVSTPDSVRAWVEKLRGRVSMYFLDNEPELWDSTHRDVHPDPVTYDELLDKTIRYATEVRRADPASVIAGPSSWGWPAYFWSAADAKAGFDRAPDRRAHGNMAFIPWYLKEVRASEQRTGIRLLDILDVHFYPAAEGVSDGGGGGNDPATAALRIRQVRGLWDRTYSDESWVGEPIFLIPRLRDWINQYAPGLGISIGEWNFGGQNHISGALATAEALGRFGMESVTSAYYWTSPPTNSPSYWAFRAYRNFDGSGGRFLDNSLATTMGADLSLFASTNDDRSEVTAVVLNTNATRTLTPNILLKNCKGVASVESFSYAGGSGGLTSKVLTKRSDSSIPMSLPAYSLSVLRVRLS